VAQSTCLINRPCMGQYWERALGSDNIGRKSWISEMVQTNTMYGLVVKKDSQCQSFNSFGQQEEWAHWHVGIDEHHAIFTAKNDVCVAKRTAVLLHHFGVTLGLLEDLHTAWISSNLAAL
jgi:hypothetical protein